MAKNTLERIFESIQWLESLRTEKFSLDEMASIACLSSYHFSRVFSSLTGMSPALYYRRRLLTNAAHRLLEGDDRIIDIALEYGYQSHEAFTRAFKKMFHLNPDDLKKQNKDFTALYQKPVTEDFLKHFGQKGLTTEPVVRKYNSFKVSGVCKKIGFDDLEKANDVWLEYFKDNTKDKDQYYGVCRGTYEDNMPSSKLSYTAGHFADQGIDVRGGHYAVFIHKGNLVDITTTLQYIWQTWATRSGAQLRKAPDFELYDARFNQETLQGEIEICIPIEG